jgi:deazaflavin-dependent oxidoreductase (nitroreductase family)
MEDELVRDGRVARLEVRGRHSGLDRSVTVGFVELPAGALAVAARAPEADWARNLEADPEARVTIGDRTFAVLAQLMDDDDPRRPGVIRGLILRYGTPSEALGRGPVFVLVPAGSV